MSNFVQKRPYQVSRTFNALYFRKFENDQLFMKFYIDICKYISTSKHTSIIIFLIQIVEIEYFLQYSLLLLFSLEFSIAA